MIVELTEKMIQDAFAKTGIDQKYYPQYEAEAKRRYNALQEEDPDHEESPDMDNAYISIDLTNEYIVYYVAEIEKGHCHKWSHSYALNSIWPENEFTIVSNALDSLKNDERKKELELHAKTINKDPVFVDCYINSFEEGIQEPRKKAEEYCRSYHSCIKDGKSICYAKNYAEIESWREFVEEYCRLYAEVYDYADKQGVKDDPSLFASDCAEAYVNGRITDLIHLKEPYKADWQQEYLSQLQDRIMREQETEVDPSTFGTLSSRRKTHEEAIWDMMYPEGIDDGFSLPED